MSAEISIRNGQVLLADGRIETTDVLVEYGRVSRVGHAVKAGREIDVSGCIVLPGLIDLHMHGIQDQSASLSRLDSIAAIEASRGATTFYPTLFAPPYDIESQLLRHRKETDDLRLLPQVGGFRLESPYLATAGGGMRRDTTPVSTDITRMLLEAGGGHIKIWDVSPELDGACEAIAEITNEGVVVSLAHTHATIDQARAAVDAGARLVTHLYDTFVPPPMSEPGVYPEGLTDYLLVDDRVMCEIIGDSTHVPPLLVEKAFRCKTPDRLAFVTDSNLGAGLAPGQYDLPMGWGLAAVNGPNNGVRLVDRGMSLCGSALTPIDAFRNVVQLFGKDIATASHVCSRSPARLMGLNKGEIAPGRDGDLIIVDDSLEILFTLVGGEVVYKR